MNGFGRRSIIGNLRDFLSVTEKYTSQNTEPGDYYKAVWCRDAAYILKDQFLSGHSAAVLDQLKNIWNKQIGTNSTKLIYGRGSPKTSFTPLDAESGVTGNFYGALPTTIFDNFSEIYALNPDIDSTALMIYVSTWILTNMIRDSVGKSEKVSATVTELTEYLTPFLYRGIDYLTSRDEDNDGLLEQDHNEDWMDTVLRDGKVVYSQACWLLALTSFANLLFVRGKEDEAQRLRHMASELVDSIENNMWSEEAKCYVGLNSDKLQGKDSEGILYQDIVFYAFAMTETLPHIVPNFSNIRQFDMDPKHENRSLVDDKKALKIKQRLILTLGSLKNRIWLQDIPLVTERPLLKTAPWILQSNEYHNYTHWPWITAVELLTRFRFGQTDECNLLLSNLFNRNGKNKKSDHDNIFYEWLNPTTKTGGGAYPFRTGISAYRLTSFEMMSKV
ncbi:MAG TPA: hypothetical protein VFR61_08655 [Nitrososphaeraceae archaeon]|jgi:hypothetical protein|nr:hypothetical protein [Nitrososphaeraceae archaeon]